MQRFSAPPTFTYNAFVSGVSLTNTGVKISYKKIPKICTAGPALLIQAVIESSPLQQGFKVVRGMNTKYPNRIFIHAKL
eukprot:256666-Pyramimonas_sp.AAC.2